MRSWIIIVIVALCASCKGPKALPQDNLPVGIELAAIDSLGAVIGITEGRYQGLTPRQKRRQIDKDRKALVKIAKYKAGPRKIKITDKSKVKPTIKFKPVTKTDNSQGKGAWKTWAAIWVVAGAVLLVLIYRKALYKIFI